MLNPHGYQLHSIVNKIYFYVHVRQNVFKNLYIKKRNYERWPSNRHLHISTTYYQSINVTFIIMSAWYIPMNLKWEISQSQRHLYIYIFFRKGIYCNLSIKLYEKRDYFQFFYRQILTYVLMYLHHMHMDFLSLS